MAPTPGSGMPAMAKQSTPKTMSSRLMTMKFMQRGAAAAVAAAAAGTPEASSPATPRSDDGSAKRRKFAHTPSSAASSPATPLYDQTAIRAALEQEEKKRQAAVEKRAAELGDSHWVLEGAANLPTRGGSQPLLNVVQVGFAQIDYAGTTSGGADDDPFDSGTVPGQTQFRRFNMKKKSKACLLRGEDNAESSNSNSDSASGSGSDSEEGSEDERSAREEPGRGRRNVIGGDAERSGRARSSVSGRREEERRKAQQLAGKRRKKEIKLNQLSSISSAGSQAFQRPSPAMSCHGCGKPGHKVADCPNKRR
ncbi:hypothetical protein C8A00DRAFT_40826 [Chaetomidium leptoderma]|uniref:CCHC-type domain-containing protein n=1 Tax=Chaetomidium leptoderma TaxID=669021 RepID=A0AAN6VTP9_9PEZI|nr:hypothetical protein C8A00DRAFT_40826 [Chaetomidium leptoderma]